MCGKNPAVRYITSEDTDTQWFSNLLLEQMEMEDKKNLIAE